MFKIDNQPVKTSEPAQAANQTNSRMKHLRKAFARHLLQPPVCNQLVFAENDFIVMVVGGPNSRKDYHYDEGPEFFYQLEGDMLLKTMQDGEAVDIPIKEGEILLLPPKVPHSPQRFANTVGLVVERKRLDDELDGFMWFCENCNNKLYEEYLYQNDMGLFHYSLELYRILKQHF